MLEQRYRRHSRYAQANKQTSKQTNEQTHKQYPSLSFVAPRPYSSGAATRPRSGAALLNDARAKGRTANTRTHMHAISNPQPQQHQLIEHVRARAHKQRNRILTYVHKRPNNIYVYTDALMDAYIRRTKRTLQCSSIQSCKQTGRKT